MIIYGCLEIILSQIPNLHKVWWLSIVVAVMEFVYSFVGIGLAGIRIAGGDRGVTTLTGAIVGVDISGMDKMWKSFQSLGNIASAFSYSLVLIEIQAAGAVRSPELHPHERDADKAYMRSFNAMPNGLDVRARLDVRELAIQSGACDSVWLREADTFRSAGAGSIVLFLL